MPSALSACACWSQPCPLLLLPADISQWGGDIFADLRNFSTGSGTQPGSLTGKNSFTTDWIPELLSRRRDGSSGRLDPVAAAVAAPVAAAAPTGAVVDGDSTPGAAGEGGQQQKADSHAGTAAAAGGGGADGGDVGPQAAADAGAGGAKGRKGKRERSKTGQAPTAEQRQEWQVGVVSRDGCGSASCTVCCKACWWRAPCFTWRACPQLLAAVILMPPCCPGLVLFAAAAAAAALCRHCLVGRRVPPTLSCAA